MAHQRHELNTGLRCRPETDWVWSHAPAIISLELFEKAQVQLHRNAELARKTYQPASRRYLLRRLVKCGACGLAMTCTRQLSACHTYEYLYNECKGHMPLTCGRVQKCRSRRVRADRLDAVVWQALNELLQRPAVIPHLHQTWAHAKQHYLDALTAQQAQLFQRQQRLERQSQRLLDAYQAEIISLDELHSRRRKLTAEREQIEQERQQFARTQQQTRHWQQIIEHTETFRHLLGDNLDRLSFEERQAVTQCLVRKVVVTGEQVDIDYVLPFEGAPQAADGPWSTPEGTPGHVYRLRLAHFDLPAQPVPLSEVVDTVDFRIKERGDLRVDTTDQPDYIQVYPACMCESVRRSGGRNPAMRADRNVLSFACPARQYFSASRHFLTRPQLLTRF